MTGRRQVSAGLRRRLAVVRQDPGQLAQGFLVTFVDDIGKVAGQLQTHALACREVAVALAFQAFEEMADGNPQYLSNFMESPGRDPVDPSFVLVGLLISDADQISHLLLG